MFSKSPNYSIANPGRTILFSFRCSTILHSSLPMARTYVLPPLPFCPIWPHPNLCSVSLGIILLLHLPHLPIHNLSFQAINISISIKNKSLDGPLRLPSFIVYNTCLSFSHLEHDFYDSTQRTGKHLYCRRIGLWNLFGLDFDVVFRSFGVPSSLSLKRTAAAALGIGGSRPRKEKSKQE